MKKYKYPYLNPELSVKKRVADLVSRLTADEKLGLLPARQRAIPRLGIEENRIGTEVARGYISREEGENSTVFPQPIGLASTFDPALMYKLGEICGIETRIHHAALPYQKLMVWGPTVDLCRHPLWGRNEEGYGEDAFLTGELTTAYTKGMAGKHKKYLRVLAGLKHFCCNNHEEDRLTDSANVDARLLREYYYASFEASIKAKGAHSLMTAYNELSGVPGMINPDLKKVCKKEWGMLFAVTDGGDFTQNVNFHGYSDSHAETIALAFRAGNNIMTDIDATTLASAKEAVKKGVFSMKELDAAISEVLAGRFMLGEFDRPEMNPYNDIPVELLNCDEFRAVNARAARECITLLKNDNLLPMKDDCKIKVAVIGHLAESTYKDWYTGISTYNVTILNGLKAALGKDRVTYHDGCDIVAIKSLLTGKYLQVKDDGSVAADSDKITKACRFKKVDWDYEATYRSEMSGKLLYLHADDMGEDLKQERTGFVNATGGDTFEWFGRMIIRPDEYEGNIIYKSWRKKDIYIDNSGRLCETECGGITKAKLFAEEYVEDGAHEAAKLAEKADYVIVCAGNDPMVPARECWDRKSLVLPAAQQRIIGAANKVNKNTILTITSSYPYTFDWVKYGIGNSPAAIIYTGHPGPEGGGAMADVLLGRYNPAGRTPQTWYKNEKDLPSLKDYDIMYSKYTYQYFEGEELYPFGHGLSYSSFEYSDLKLKSGGDNIEVSLKVKNTSAVYGEEVVQVYFTALNPRVRRPKKQLCDFIRQGIEPGQTVHISFVFDKSRLRFWDVTRGKFAVETGEYRFSVGASSKDIRLSSDITVKGEKIPPRSLAKKTPAVNFDDRRAVILKWDKKLERHYIHAPNWNGAIDFYDVELVGATGFEVSASINVSQGKIAVFAKEKLAGEIEIPAVACPTAFKKYKCTFKKPLKGKGKLTLKIPEHINLLDVKLL